MGEGSRDIMSDSIETAGAPQSLVNAAHLVYALHALSIVIGITTAATIVGAFVFGVPSIIAVVINYLKRAEASGTYLESHFRWQIRTFWFAFLWLIIGAVSIVLLIGIAILGVLTLWLIYRIARGWLRLRRHRPMYVG